MVWGFDQFMAYLALWSEQPALFQNPASGGIQILREKKEILEAEDRMATTVEARAPKSWRRIGVLYSDKYYTLIKDAVRFPDHHLATYTRILLTNREAPGVAIFPFRDNKIVLLKQFRHATRRAHLAIPRGFGEPGVSAEESAHRELREELNCQAITMEFLGTVHPDSAILAYDVNLFRAQISGEPKVEKAEAIEDIVELTPDEFINKVGTNEITDSFTLAAFSKLMATGKL